MTTEPIGWTDATFGELFDHLQYGLTASADANAPGIRFLRITDLEDGAVNWKSVPGLIFDDDTDRYRLANGDFVFARSGSIEKAARIEHPPNAVFASYLIRGRLLCPDFSDWMKQFIRSNYYRDQIKERSAGIGMPNVNATKLASVSLPVPPIPEQRRIVAKIDSLSGKSERARGQLDHIPLLVEKYKQAILAAAFQGDLSKDWRTRNAGHDGPWSESSLIEVAEIGTGSTPKRGEKRYYCDGHIPWVTSGVVNAPVVQSADEYITDAAIQETNCKVFPAGTILMAMYGEGQTRGRVAVLGIDAATNQALAAIQVAADGPAIRDFVLWHLRSGYLDLRQKAAGGVQPNLNLGIIKAWPIPLPSREEQREIVRRIETAFSWINRLAAETTSARKLIDHLDQSVLAKAFRGELVPQDPNDEPANVLLERIKADGQATPKRIGRRMRF